MFRPLYRPARHRRLPRADDRRPADRAPAPRNRIAWIMLLGAFVADAPAPARVLARPRAGRSRSTARLWPLLYAWPIAVAFVFPNGKLLSPRWRWVALGAAIVSFVGVIASHALRPRPVLRRRRRVPNPMEDNAVAGPVLDGISSGCRSALLRRHARQPRRRRGRDPDPASALGRDRAAADDLARLVGHARPGHASPSASPRGSSVWRLGVTIVDCHRLSAPAAESTSRSRRPSGSRSAATGCTRSSGS